MNTLLFPSAPVEKDYYTVDELARRFNLAPATVRRNALKLAPLRCGREYRFPKDVIKQREIQGRLF